MAKRHKRRNAVYYMLVNICNWTRVQVEEMKWPRICAVGDECFISLPSHQSPTNY